MANVPRFGFSLIFEGFSKLMNIDNIYLISKQLSDYSMVHAEQIADMPGLDSTSCQSAEGRRSQLGIAEPDEPCDEQPGLVK